MSKIVDNETLQEALVNEDYQKIMSSSARRFAGILSSDEIESCKKKALWKALESYDPTRVNSQNKTSKFTSYLYRGVMLECKTQVKFVINGRNNLKQCHENLGSVDNYFSNIEIFDELNSIKHGDILLDFFFNGLSVKEIAEKHEVSSQTIGVRKKKALNLLKSRFC